MTNKKRVFSTEFKLESAQLVEDQNYSINDAAVAVGVGKSTLEYWVRQLRKERQGKTLTGAALALDQQRIKELEKQLKRVELEKEILKKATALLMEESLTATAGQGRGSTSA